MEKVVPKSYGQLMTDQSTARKSAYESRSRRLTTMGEEPEPESVVEKKTPDTPQKKKERKVRKEEKKKAQRKQGASSVSSAAPVRKQKNPELIPPTMGPSTVSHETQERRGIAEAQHIKRQDTALKQRRSMLSPRRPSRSRGRRRRSRSKRRRRRSKSRTKRSKRRRRR